MEAKIKENGEEGVLLSPEADCSLSQKILR